MAESVNGGSNTPAQPPKEMSMEVRLLIAFLLMGAVMFVTPYFFKSQVPPPGKKDAAVQTTSQKTDAAVPTGPDGKPAPAATAPAEPAARRPLPYPCLPAPRRRSSSPPSSSKPTCTR